MARRLDRPHENKMGQWGAQEANQLLLNVRFAALRTEAARGPRRGFPGGRRVRGRCLRLCFGWRETSRRSRAGQCFPRQRCQGETEMMCLEGQLPNLFSARDFIDFGGGGAWCD